LKDPNPNKTLDSLPADQQPDSPAATPTSIINEAAPASDN
jgi:hypothetical protein